ncbi:MAG: hypothetical protein V1918_07125 [Planctomycetota bacterium]
MPTPIMAACCVKDTRLDEKRNEIRAARPCSLEGPFLKVVSLFPLDFGNLIFPNAVESFA